MKDEIDRLRQIVERAENIVFFGGAGVSTESDIPDFRSGSGLYSEKQYRYPPEQMLHHQFFFSHTEEFYDYYFNKMIYPNARPNTAHKALARLEEKGKVKAVITQNIDGLHQKAGSRRVIELHGSVLRNFCTVCKKGYSLEQMLQSRPNVPKCGCGGIIKPDVVLYGEQLEDKSITQAVEAIEAAQVLIIGGTSLSVYPAAGLVNYYKGDKLVIINQSITGKDESADLVIRGKIGQVLAEV